MKFVEKENANKDVVVTLNTNEDGEVKLENVDLSSLDTSCVTNMSGMFAGCKTSYEKAKG